MSKPAKRLNLALQGGGAHGAFTWGVLDRLLEEEGLEIAGISGTSAGALNGAALKAGLLRGGRQAARENLDWLWQQIGAVGDMRLAAWFRAFLPATRLWEELTERFVPFSPGETATRLFSPYDYGPFYVNPLERIIKQFRFAEICSPVEPHFYVAATNVRTGKIKVFSGAEVTEQAILGSACLPTIFKAVEIPDPATGRTEHYWDGGYTGNPALFPLFAPSLPQDIVIVSVNPRVREEIPVTAQEILDRINEVSFNASLLSEIRAIGFVKRLIREGRTEPGAMKDVLLHFIADDGLMNSLSARSKMLPEPGMLAELKEAGRAAAGRFLADHGHRLNTEDSTKPSDIL
ncbi:MAG: patatin-like phospholipase family protein [Rhodobacteraceae bacterium]|nr:patatin-like phospholipase family protein [Paracoccaceae bacterium]